MQNFSRENGDRGAVMLQFLEMVHTHHDYFRFTAVLRRLQNAPLAILAALRFVDKHGVLIGIMKRKLADIKDERERFEALKKVPGVQVNWSECLVMKLPCHHGEGAFLQSGIPYRGGCRW